MMSNILIAGCGYVGTTLGLRLAREGHAVWGLRRQAEKIPKPIQPVEADLSKPKTLREIPSPLDFVFYTAAADHADDEAYRQTYVLGIRHLLDALDRRRQPVKRFFFTSSTAVYGQSAGEWVDENSPTLPAGFSGKRLLEAEGLVLNGPFSATIVRLAGIYGPGRTRLLEQARRGESFISGNLTVYSNRIHRDDCAGILRHLMMLKAPESCYLGVDHEPTQQVEVLRWLAGQLSIQETSIHPVTSEKGPSPPGSAGDDRTRQRTNKRCSSERLVRSGYTFHYPSFREGYAAILEEIQSAALE